MDTLQRNGYDLAKAMSTLVPQGGPVLCRDEMEEWSASEAMLFEEALEKYGKDFNDIRQDFVSGQGWEERWKSRQVRERGPGARCQLSFLPSASLAALEVTRQHSPVLLHVENHRPLYSAGMGWAGKAGPGASCSPLPLKLMTSSCGGALILLFLPFFPFLQKRLKAAEADSKLKQVYIPT